ncbi:MAG TPA: hypothetical protein VF705_10430 [Longimicrobium sp.]
MKSNRLSLSAFLALAAIVSASPAVAQGKGHGNGKHDRPRQEVRRDDDRERERRDDRWERERREGTRFERRESRNVPRGWCQGRGNPHNTAANCGYRGDLDRVYRDRNGVLRDRNGRVIRSDGSVYNDRGTVYNGGGSSHTEYHRWHDQQCRDRSAQAGGITGRIRVAAQCKAEHDAWHRQQGTSH